MSEELLPCPFCQGIDVHLHLPTCNKKTPYDPADRAFPIVRCRSCDASKDGENWDQSGRSAIESWNTRAAEDPWKGLFWAVARVLNCLPSTFPDANQHVFKAAEKLAAMQSAAYAGNSKPVAWSRTRYIYDNDEREIGLDEPEICWTTERPEGDEWLPLFEEPTTLPYSA